MTGILFQFCQLWSLTKKATNNTFEWSSCLNPRKLKMLLTTFVTFYLRPLIVSDFTAELGASSDCQPFPSTQHYPIQHGHLVGAWCWVEKVASVKKLLALQWKVTKIVTSSLFLDFVEWTWYKMIISNPDDLFQRGKITGLYFTFHCLVNMHNYNNLLGIWALNFVLMDMCCAGFQK